MNRFLKKLRKGFTIAEVAVAMTVITIVSIVTISLIERCRDISAKSKYYAEAREIADNSLEVFKFSNSELEYWSCMTEIGNKYTKEANTFKFENNIYVLKITVTFSDTQNDTYESICYSPSGKLIFRSNYNKR